MLSVDKLNQYYGESHILRDLSLDVPAGRCTCVMGRNGVGKTTLLKTVMGEVAARSGAIRFDGEELLKRRPEARAGLGIGYVPQGRQIFATLSVEENLRIGLPARRDRQRRIPERIYELFPVLKEMRYRRGGDLSGGQQQQLAIGRALVLDPRLLILDEPGEGIQPNIVAQIGEVIRRLNREDGLTVLLVEQKLPFARRYADKFMIMDRGQAVAGGDIAELSDDLIKRHLTV
ncbi:urea ABC transporter ATP-binding subunit UrtE [Salinicola sp. LHM]|uniref:urea ABC transporter ATP-binding subunit UrtE n=1 Tax=Salinicola TaxID=404432 RepID=UPI000DA18F2E|nr:MULTISPECIES: urea ABC transporter ATP-binding subunit UrtE [Salinicola]MDF3919114.1 urea ABC transporter ATP-binding subunit UrtE [Salinicola salarius]MEC8918985.1 urea ABC transporter ATP-binding subunit UrtE [Pseudomonadota bacterium]MED5501785.1 urea ABC transporter ATP-binding subunit UrtE [Pseudomonadota bacterium]WQH31884.1 urea ABC transporter ATP-binding subunit UrtE [Salinicola sp. LHM]